MNALTSLERVPVRSADVNGNADTGADISADIGADTGADRARHPSDRVQPLVQPPVQQFNWHSRFGSMLIEVRVDAIYVNGQRVEQAPPGP